MAERFLVNGVFRRKGGKDFRFGTRSEGKAARYWDERREGRGLLEPEGFALRPLSYLPKFYGKIAEKLLQEFLPPLGWLWPPERRIPCPTTPSAVPGRSTDPLALTRFPTSLLFCCHRRTVSARGLSPTTIAPDRECAVDD